MAQQAYPYPLCGRRTQKDGGFLFRSVRSETLLIAALCMLDLVSTLYWVSHGYAREANPLLAYFLERGTLPFILAKIVTFVPALIVAEWYRALNPALITATLRLALVGYVALYAIGFTAENGALVARYLQQWLPIA